MRLLPLLLLVACPRSKPVTPAEGSGSTQVASEMRDHFLAAIATQDAVIVDDLEGAKRAVASLRTLGGPDTPPSWDPYLRAVEAGADMVATASDRDGAALGVARIGVACGSCHAASGAGPVIDPVTPPAFGEGQQMVRHQWAADRMWLGLTGPSDQAWTTASALLADTPLGPASDVEAEARARFVAIEGVLTDVGKRAVTAERAERAPLYATALAQCASCHGPSRE